MRDEDMARFEEEIERARTDAEIAEVTRRWSPTLAKCFRSTSLRVKALSEKFDGLRDDLLKATTEISSRITELHKKPSFRESKVEWIFGNIERILLTLIVLALVFGRDWVSHLFSH